MANISRISGLDSRPPLSQRTFITVADADDAGTLWERTEGRVVEKSLVASYSKVEDIDQCWLFSRMFQRPKYIQASSLQLACLRFLQSIGVQGHIRVQQGTPEGNSL
ncbi:MAG TPA: hypothetical protein VFH43_05870 [Candidatus Kapabacteria bacterium]|nr:hypothetical protein [Candidatus Kapabacteria bacterium]